MTVVCIRKMTEQDIPDVERLMELSFSNPWSTELLQKELQHPWSTVFLAEPASSPNQVWGLGVFWKVHDELHVLNLATHPDARRQGLGRQLMEAGLALGRQQGCSMATLEVRKSNHAAIALYQKLGFERVGLRRGYYVEEGEDAVLMSLQFSESR